MNYDQALIMLESGEKMKIPSWDKSYIIKIKDTTHLQNEELFRETDMIALKLTYNTFIPYVPSEEESHSLDWEVWR